MYTLINELAKYGAVIHLDDLSHINTDADIVAIIDELKEDLLQATFPKNELLDIGWYPEFCENGAFRVSLIQDLDWEHPLFCKTIKSWPELSTAVKDALSHIRP